VTRPIIEVENLSKMYRLGVIGATTLRDSFQRWWHRVIKREELGHKINTEKVMIEPDHPQAGEEPNTFWALRDVSFSVNRGEVIGIIGPNGAGKSTLLKILSHITEPTYGFAKIRGRLASLLEVGTGFHPELTGRENIFLNGTILGMTKAEIKTKFDEIVDFAEIKQFIDTPVKRYSSGMFVRLAFSVAAHLEPEILLVDEVLAVGDAQFQKKCLGKMEDIGQEGRTVLFVSHNMAAIKFLCHRAILLDRGQMILNTDTDRAIRHYLEDKSKLLSVDLQKRQDRKGTGKMRFDYVKILDKSRKPIGAMVIGQPAIIRIYFSRPFNETLKNMYIDIGIDDAFGIRLTHLANDISGSLFFEVPSECNAIDVLLPRVPLMPGRYTLSLYARINNEIADWVESAFSFNVQGGDFFGTGRILHESHGKFLFEHEIMLVSYEG